MQIALRAGKHIRIVINLFAKCDNFNFPLHFLAYACVPPPLFLTVNEKKKKRRADLVADFARKGASRQLLHQGYFSAI